MEPDGGGLQGGTESNALMDVEECSFCVESDAYCEAEYVGF